MSTISNSSDADGTRVLDDADLGFLGSALTPMEPDAGASERILSRVKARIHAERAIASRPTGDQDIVTRHFDEVGWDELAPGARQRVLYDDGRFRTVLVSLEAGACLPMHEHTLEEECFVVEGDIWLSGVHMSRGDYQRVPPGTSHVDIRSDTGCLLHVRAESGSAHMSV